MKSFEIQISYSWGDEESPIEIEAESELDAFLYMLELAVEELKVSMQDGHEDESHVIRSYPNENRIILYYGYDDEECYYDLVEIRKPV